MQAELSHIVPGFKKDVILIYKSSHLKGSSKVRFFYALKGRPGYSGILEKTNSKFLKRGVILTPLENFPRISEFLREWDCNFKALQVEKELNTSKVGNET